MSISKDSRIGVIGYGSWATALVSVLTSSGRRVSWHILNPEILEGVREESFNVKYLPDKELDSSLIDASADVNEVVCASDILILAMPSAYLKSYLEPCAQNLEGKFLVSAVKGIVPEENLTVTGYLHGVLGVPYSRMGVICGPTHAEEVALGRMTYITAACEDVTDAQAVKEILGGRNLKVEVSSDIYGLEYAAVAKNIYAIAAGMATGLGYGDNFLAVLVSSCAAEMERFLSLTGPSGTVKTDRNRLGDLLVTCYSSYSRNRRLGQLIGKGCSVKSALNEMTMVAEGYFAACGMHEICARHGIEMPIMEMVYNVLYCKASARKEMKKLSETL